MTPNSSNPWNLTKGFNWKAVISSVKPGLMSPDVNCALVVACVFSRT
jgi:hypothetical protein